MDENGHDVDPTLQGTLAHLEGLMEPQLQKPFLTEGIHTPEDPEAAELAKVRDLRRELGMPEKSPLLYDVPTNEEREVALETYYQQEINTYLAKGQGFIDSNKKGLDQLRSRQISRGSREVEIVIKGLELARVPQARAYVDTLSQRLLGGIEINKINSIRNLANIGLTPDQLGTALDRLGLLGFNIYGVADLTEALGTNRGFDEHLKVFATANEETFQKLCTELNPHFYLRMDQHQRASLTKKDGNKAKLNRNVGFFANVLASGGFTSQQQQRFNLTLHRYLLFKDMGPFNTPSRPIDITEEDIAVFRIKYEKIEKNQDIAEGIMYGWLQESDHPKPLRNLDIQRIEARQAEFKACVDAGITIPRELILSDGNTPIVDIDAVSSPAKVAWIALFQELREQQIVGYSNIDSNIVNLYEHRQDLADIAVILNALPEMPLLSFAGIVGRGDVRGRTYNLDTLNRRLLERLQQQRMSGLKYTDNKFLLAAAELANVGGVNVPTLPLLTFLARKKDSLDSYIHAADITHWSYVYVDLPLIQAAAQGEFEASHDVMRTLFKSYFHINNTRSRAPLPTDLLLQFKDDIRPADLVAELRNTDENEILNSSHLTDHDKEMLLVAKKYHLHGAFILSNPEKFNEFVTNGKLNHNYFLTVVSQDTVHYPAVFSSTWGKELLDSFSEPERQFWQVATDTGVVGPDIVNLTKALQKNEISLQLAVDLMQSSPVLWTDQMQHVRNALFRNLDLYIKDVSDINFLTSLVGNFGAKAEAIILGYKASLDAKVITIADKPLVSEFLTHFRVLSPAIIAGYKEAKAAGHAEVYLSQLKNVAEAMTGARVLTEAERKQPYYNDLIHHVYPHNAGQWSTYERNAKCEDRTHDLDEFTIQPRYEIDLLSQSAIRLKEGQTTNEEAKESLKKQVYDVASFINENGHDKEKILGLLEDQIDSQLALLQESGRLSSVDLSELSTLDEKLFLLLAENAFGKPVDPNLLKRFIITYEFAMFEDITDYIQGTNDRVSRSSNPDYALFCELSTFYGDRIKEVNRKLTQAGFASDIIGPLMQQYFHELASGTANQARIDQINRLRVDQLGLSSNFIDQVRPTLETKPYSKKQLRRIGQLYRTLSGTEGSVDSELIEQVRKTLSTRRRQEYSDDQIREMIYDYETTTEGLTQEPDENDRKGQILHRQLASQRKKTFDALMTIDGTVVNPSNIHLGEINLQEALQAEAAIREGVYDEQQFTSYTAQRLVGIFSEEQLAVHNELGKFESESGKEREVL